MDIIQVPEVTGHHARIAAGDITFVDYQDKGSAVRSRVLFSRYAFSFVQSGQKQLYRGAENVILTPGHGLLIPEGNSIIAEHNSDVEKLYSSVIVFFPGHIGKAFMAGRRPIAVKAADDAPYIHFKTDNYINEYVRNLKALIACGQSLSVELATLKVTELLTAMYETAPELLMKIFGPPANLSLKNIVENNLVRGLSLEELAFLANRSLSAFKRDFEKAYGLSPQKYIRERKLELACAELANGKSASELYLDYGYQHVSNFNTAFKRKYGVTPACFRQSA